MTDNNTDKNKNKNKNKINKYVTKILFNLDQNQTPNEKFKVYMQKLFYYVSNKDVKNPCINFMDKDYLFNYLKKLINNPKIQTKNKYFVILIGPSASGKSIARDYSINIINQIEKMDKHSLKGSFIDINIDDIALQCINQDMVELSRELKNNISLTNIQVQDYISECNKQINCDVPIQETQPNDFIIQQQNKYFEARKHIENIPMIITFLALHLNQNIFFETTGSNYDYLTNNIITNMCFYNNYIPVVIYPYTELCNLYQRSLSRGKEEGRIPSKQAITKMYCSIKPVFDKLINFFNDIKDNKYILLKYDNNGSKNEKKKILYYSSNILDKPL